MVTADNAVIMADALIDALKRDFDLSVEDNLCTVCNERPATDDFRIGEK